jgi:hypothetical protein
MTYRELKKFLSSLDDYHLDQRIEVVSLSMERYFSINNAFIEKEGDEYTPRGQLVLIG